MLERKNWLIARRCVQFVVLLAFASGPQLGYMLAQGTLASSVWLGVVPLSDPFVLLQILAAGHPLGAQAIFGGLLVVVFYALVGGRVFCGWVCPINIITDCARGLRRILGWRRASVIRVDKRLRYLIFFASIALSYGLGIVVWELLNPINMVVRSLVFGLWVGGLVALVGIFLFDFLLLSSGWCGHICPVGASYGQLGRAGLVRVAAVRRDACNNCGDCFEYCPEPQVISPALRAIDGHDVFIREPDCLRCGRCIDVCEQQVFEFFVPGLPSANSAAPKRAKP